ncbi:helix-turn-helix transcriptional regulator [Neobacillus sp. CF12]|uniref:helix-turn-helix transcriptional regulator n=1 Tax=Neobacillus sp. CF12 TaxID=3055864 RepID=UPI0025A01B77|nr:helix-turn-helix transcriptional regulator [Neobacillus sp. CF12]MDM5330340.1 helix-turn-helix transcriptional regulator [Neobacillus sp. CF12]
MIISVIGERIKESGYRRDYIQEHMEISRNTLSNWCTGKTYPTAPQLFKLANLLSVKVDDLYKLKEDYPK